MKRIATLAVILMLSLAASATSVRYFTYSQADRTVRYLYAQNEMMIYCGYDYEIETYVLINDVWMERVNSSYYEIWVYGYDAYTGDEICMPLDLGCVWLFSAGRVYNAAQYLRFHSSARPPHFTWYIPSYNRFVRVRHQPGFRVSYHYDIHRHGWMPPAPGHNPHHPLPPYYMRTPGSTAPHPVGPWTPGVDHPQITPASAQGRTGSGGRVTTGGSHTQSSSSASGSSGVRTGSSGSTSSPRQTGGTTTGTSSTRQSTGASTGTTPTRGNATGNRNTQATQSEGSRTGSSSATSSSGRGSNTNGTTASSSSRGKNTTSGTTTSSSRGNSSSSGTTATSSSRGNSSSSGTTASSSSRGKTNSGSTANTSSSRGKTSGTTTKRGSSTSSSRGTTTSSNDKAKKGSSTSSSRGTTSSSRSNSGRTR